VAGKINGAANFNATNQYVNLGPNYLVPGNSVSFSASAWIKASTSQLQFPQILTFGDSTGVTGYNLYLVNNAYAAFIVGQ
jgi:hypothetical protein